MGNCKDFLSVYKFLKARNEMKTKIPIVFGVVCMVLLTGCNRGYNSNLDNLNNEALPSASAYYIATSPILTNTSLDNNIELVLSDTNFNDRTMVRTISNKSSYSIIFNPSAFVFEFLQEETWVEIDFSEFFSFTETASTLEPLEEHSSLINLSYIPIEFERGLYRIRIEVWPLPFDYRQNQDTLHHLIAEFYIT